ncbi:MAG: hypothetical protein GY950_28255 [bacterium]|nr:hypothetical protein [bacterium]
MKKFSWIMLILFTVLIRFTVDASTIAVTAPNGGETIPAGTVYNIAWNASAEIENVIIEYSINSGTSWSIIAQGVSNTGNYSWTVPDTPSDNCLVRISGTDTDDTASDVSDAGFSIVVAASGAIRVISPNGGENVNVGSVCGITWTTSESFDNVKIDYSMDNGVSWTEIVQSTANNGSYHWNVPGTPSDSCLIRVSETGGGVYDVSDGEEFKGTGHCRL